MSSSPTTSLDNASIDQLSGLLRDRDPARRIDAIRALGRRRGHNVVRLLALGRGDSSPEVRRLAEEMHAVVEADTTLFGPGETLRIVLPAPIPTLEQERRSMRFIWVMWIAGGLLTINAMLFQEHTGLRWTPILAVCGIMILVVFLSTRLIRPKDSPGTLVLDLESRALVLEHYTPGGRSFPAADIRGLRIDRRQVPTPEEEPPRFVHEAVLELAGGETLVLARCDRPDEIEPLAARLRYHLDLMSAVP